MLPADSSTEETSLIDIVGAESSSVIVMLAEPADALTVALVGEESVTVKVSFSSSIVSERMGIFMLCVVVFGVKEEFRLLPNNLLPQWQCHQLYICHGYCL